MPSVAVGIGILGVNLFSGVQQAQALKRQGAYQRSMYELNARFAEINAEDAIRRGDRAARDLKTQSRGLIGSQRVGFAAQGVSVDTGTAVAVQEDTDRLSTIDAMTIKNNAWREAWGYRVEAATGRAQGQMAQTAAGNAARSTLLTAGLQGITGFVSAGGFKGISSYLQSSEAPLTTDFFNAGGSQLNAPVNPYMPLFE